MTIHKPRRREPASWAAAIASSQPFTEAQATGIVNLVRIAWQRLREGTAEADHFIRIGCCINVASVRAEEIGSNTDVLASLAAAGAALVDCQDRRDRLGRYGLTGPGLQAVGAAIDVYEQVLRASSPKQMQLAEREVIRRLDTINNREQAWEQSRPKSGAHA